jgi:hypothetical protein
MPRGDTSSYTEKQKRKAEHIEEGYEHRGVGQKEAERRARGERGNAPRKEERFRSRKVEDHSPSRKGGISAVRRPLTALLRSDPGQRRRPLPPGASGDSGANALLSQWSQTSEFDLVANAHWLWRR